MSKKKSAPLSGLASTLKMTLTCYPNRLYHWIFLPDGLKKNISNMALFSTSGNAKKMSAWDYLSIAAPMILSFGSVNW